MGADITIRVTERQRTALLELSQHRNVTVTETLGAAIEALKRQDFFEAMARAEADARADTGAWAEYQTEARRWLEAP